MILSQLIKIDNRFEKSVNLLLDLNSDQKINSYIPTRSSIGILSTYLQEVIKFSGNRATLLVGPYGKGKSHLLLVLLAILSKHQSPELSDLIERIKASVPECVELLTEISKDEAPMLPVIINTTSSSLEHAFSRSLNIALENAGLYDVIPDSVFTEALKAIENWRNNYPGTYNAFVKRFGKKASNKLITGLEHYDDSAYSTFVEIYPLLSSGAQFNPNVDNEVISVYRSVNRKLRERHGYKGIFIVFDEFSKYIEGHEEAGFASDMKVLQDMCELANTSRDEQLHITCVTHKSIRSYGNSLSKSVLNAFEGVEGRLKEVFFTVTSKNNYELIANVIAKTDLFDKWIADNRQYQVTANDSFALRNFSTLFTEKDFHEIVAKGCFPLTPAAAMLLLALSEKVAQNERTLFTFITSKERSGLERIVSLAKDDSFIGADRIYDYFQPTFSVESDPLIHHEWLKADYALNRTNNAHAKAIVKVMALIGMINTPDEFPAKEEQLRLSLGIPDRQFSQAIHSLVEDNLIEFKHHSDAYEFKNNIGIDLESAIADCVKKHFQKIDLGSELDQVNRIKYITPKKHNQDFCITRFFNLKFLTAQQFLKLKNRSFLKFDNMPDGVVILILPGEYDKEELTQHLEDIGDTGIVLIFPSSSASFEGKIKELLGVRYLYADSAFIDDNKVIFRELIDMGNDIADEINDLIRNSYFRSKIVYSANGPIDAGVFGLNRVISDLCDITYPMTPVINHELINRNNLSAAILKARSNLISDMLKGENLVDKYEEATSAEATIYRATLYRHDMGNENTDIGRIIDQFINNSITQKQKFSILINQLISAPYGMRKGPIPLYLADHILKLHGIPIIYLNTKEVSLDADTFSNILHSPDNYYLLVEDASVQKETYISKLSKLFSAFEVYCSDIDRRNRLAKTACLMQSWYRSLPQAAKTFNESDDPSIDMNEVSAFRSLFTDLYLNPHGILFERLPMVFSGSGYDDVILKVQAIKRHIETHVDRLKEKVVAIIREEYGFTADENLAKCLNDWYDSLPDVAKNSVLSSKAAALRKYARAVKTNDVYEIGGKIGKEITGIYIEDWKPGIEYTTFRSQLKSVLEEILQYSDKSYEEVTIPGFSDGRKIYISDSGELSTSGHFLKNALDDLFEEYETKVSNKEKIGILMNMLKEMME